MADQKDLNSTPEQNLVEQQQSENIVESFIPEEPIAPATVENQAATELAIEQEKKINEIARNFGLDPQNPDHRIRIETELAAQAEAEDLQAQAEEEQAQQAQQQQLLLNADEYRKQKDLAQKYPNIVKSFTVDPAMEELINQQEQSLKEEIPATEQDIVELQQPSLAEVEQASEPIRQQNAQQQAQAAETAKQAQEVEQKRVVANKKIQEEDSKMAQIDPNRFWNSKSTGQKIAAGIAIALGAVGGALQGTGRNDALNVLMGQIDKDIESQKLNNEQALAKKQFALKKIQQDLDRQVSQTINEQRKLQIQQLKQQMSMAEEQLSQQRLKRKMIEQGGSQDISLFGKEDRERAVRMPDGSFQLADNKAAADDVRKTQNDVQPAIQGAKRVLEISKQGSRFNLEDRARIATEMKAVVGQLRIPFTGPGILTDKEYDRLMSTLGNPNAFFALPSIERKKLETVVNKLTKDLDTRYRNAGIKPPVNPNERNIDILIKRNKGLSREQATEALKKTGRWQEF